MKKLIYSIAIALSIMTIACKKDKEVSVTGYWAGSGSNTGSSVVNFLAVLYRADNTARIYAGSGANTDTSVAVKFNGTYVIDPDSVRTTFDISSGTSIMLGKLNNSNTQMSGTFRPVTSSGASGTFTIVKN